MKDITKDLEERLDEIATERLVIVRRMDVLEETEVMLLGLLEAEKNRWADQLRFPGLENGNGASHQLSSPISRFIVTALGDGRGRSLDDLKRRAGEMALDFGDKHPGRVLHFALIGMMRNGMVERGDSGEWKLKINEMEQVG